MPAKSAERLRFQAPSSYTSVAPRPSSPSHNSSSRLIAYQSPRREDSECNEEQRRKFAPRRHPDPMGCGDYNATPGDSTSPPKSLAAKLVFDLHKGKCDDVGPRAFVSSRTEKSSVETEDSGARPILVAVRCRPRKRQRNERRSANAAAVRRTSATNRGLVSASESESEDESSNSEGFSSVDDMCSSNVRRGVFEYPPSREYNSNGHNGLPLRQRPRRLHVQAPTNGSGALSSRRSFDFDFVLPPWKKQRDVYNECVQAQIQHVLESHHSSQQPQHATIVAYGQTGTGKTYTMGMLSDFSDDEEQGLIPRSLRQIMSFAAEANARSDDDRNVSGLVVTMSFLQIYLETIQDLLVLSASSTGGSSASRMRSRRHSTRSGRRAEGGSIDLPVRQNQDGSFYVAGLSEYDICSMGDAHALLELAARNRVLASTERNKTSSRSHTLLTISLKRRSRNSNKGRSAFDISVSDGSSDETGSEGEEETVGQMSTISFVDLAGSERVDSALHYLRATRTRQELRIREAKFINRSLSALGGVIAALSQPKASQRCELLPDPVANVLARLQSSSSMSNKKTSGDTNGSARAQQQHIRFRDSQLTKLLQGRLVGGRGRLVLVATVDDQPRNLAETLSTLKFASQCRHVELQRSSELGRDSVEKQRHRRDRSRLDHELLGLKNAHENREAELHRDYQAQIQHLEGELEEAKKSLASLPMQHSTPQLNLVSYTALCSLVDHASAAIEPSKRHGQAVHPRIDTFQSEAEMVEYVTGLYCRLKSALDQPLQYVRPVLPPKLQVARVSPVQTTTDCTDSKAPRSIVREKRDDQHDPLCQGARGEKASSKVHAMRLERLSDEQEAEFRAIARHLLTTHALDSFVVSSSEDEQEQERIVSVSQ